jgi:hypothetical protein
MAHDIGTRVETFWHKDKTWFAGTVVGHGTSATTIKGKKVVVPAITIAYDDGETLTHMLHANAVRKEGGVLHLLPPKTMDLTTAVSSSMSCQCCQLC